MSKLTADDISKEDFAEYERVRRSGRCNMLSRDVERLAGIDQATHSAIIKHYGELLAKWPDVRKEDRREEK